MEGEGLLHPRQVLPETLSNLLPCGSLRRATCVLNPDVDEAGCNKFGDAHATVIRHGSDWQGPAPYRGSSFLLHWQSTMPLKCEIFTMLEHTTVTDQSILTFSTHNFPEI